MINLRIYIWYKLLNSLFFGLSVGSIFIIYTPLKPSVYSLGGVFLAISMFVVAKYYEKMINIKIFFQITLFVETIMIILILWFLYFSYSYMTALFVYISYQFTFAFGNYLVRAETIFLYRSKLLSLLDMAKQKGYLIGLLASYIFYKSLEFINITDKQTQVYYIHILLLFLQIIVITLIIKSFKFSFNKK